MACLDSCHICAVDRILILEKDETDLEQFITSGPQALFSWVKPARVLSQV